MTLMSPGSRSKRRTPPRPHATGSRSPERDRTSEPRSDTAAGLHSRTAASHLSHREREIVALLIAGRSVKEAAAALVVSPRTAEGYLERLKRRFAQPRLLALVVHLVKQGLVAIAIPTLVFSGTRKMRSFSNPSAPA